MLDADGAHVTDAEPNRLRLFDDRKSEVLRFARLLRDLAQKRADNEAAQVLDVLERRLAGNRFLVVVVGEFKRGKSSLVNALVGRDICPVKVTPRTARVTRLHAAEDGNERVGVDFRQDRPRELLPLDAIRVDDYVGHEGKRLDEVEAIDIYLQNGGPLLEEGVILVDTPGLESLFKEHDQITRDYLPRADLVVFCLSATQPLGAKERDFLLSYRLQATRLMVVLNHMDTVPADERQDTIEFVRSSLEREVFGTSMRDVSVVPMSAKGALAAKLSGDVASPHLEGLASLVSKMTTTLTELRGRPIIEAIARGQKEVAIGLAKQVAAARASWESRGPDGAGHQKALDASIDARMNALLQEVVANISLRCAALEDTLGRDVADWKTGLSDHLSGAVQQFASEAAARTSLPRLVADAVHARLSDHERALRDALADVSQAAVEETLVALRSIEGHVTEVLALGDARLQFEEMAAGLDALMSLDELANCLGGPLGGYGLATRVMDPAFTVPSGVQLLTLGAGGVSLLAMFGGPVAWLALGGWLAVILAHANRGSWQSRATRQIDHALEKEILPRIENGTRNSIRTFQASLEESMRTQTAAVRTRFRDVIATLTSKAENDQTLADGKITALDDLEREIRAVVAEIDEFLVGVSVAPSEDKAS